MDTSSQKTTMYYDLNVLWPSQFDVAGPSNGSIGAAKKAKKDVKGGRKAQSIPMLSDALQGLTPNQREKMKAMTLDMGELGYNIVAYNHVVEGKFDPARHSNPFGGTQQSQPPFPELDPRRTKVKQQDAQITQLSRMTLILNEDSMGKAGHGMNAQSTTALLGYDLLAAQAFNDASFSSLCLTLSELKPASIDIITFDLSCSARLPFFLKRSTINAAIANGVVFEICYSKMVQKVEGEDSNSRARRNIISAARDILRVTNGKNVIFSSGASDILGLRGPYDVINLAAIFGMNQAAAKDAISSTCRSLLIRAETRKTFRGAISHPTVSAFDATPVFALVPEQKGKRKQDESASDSMKTAKKSRIVPTVLQEHSTSLVR